MCIQQPEPEQKAIFVKPREHSATPYARSTLKFKVSANEEEKFTMVGSQKSLEQRPRADPVPPSRFSTHTDDIVS